jgi:tryptophan synthase alpha chain
MIALPRTSTRYDALFSRLTTRREGAFVPFFMLGHPTLDASARVIDAAVAAGADALELGIPFSDPIADGPVIQTAATRALAAGVTVAQCWELIGAIRRRHAEVPIGLLVYGNLVAVQEPAAFYRKAARAGVDSVLVADLPVAEADPYIDAARDHGIAPVFIAPPNASIATLERIAHVTQAYTYVVSRSGVTGADGVLKGGALRALRRLEHLGAPPALLGFGISSPDQVRQALDMGARGAIVGSALVALVERHARDLDRLAPEVAAAVRSLKAATRPAGQRMGTGVHSAPIVT